MEIVGAGRRFGAFLLDWILCLLVAGWFGPLAGSPWPVAALVVEQTFFIGLFGRTPGGYVARIRCVSVVTGGPLGLPRAAVRAVLTALLVPALIRDADGRGLNDRAAGCVVVAVPPGSAATHNGGGA
jgi:uncharacterized RDD family membrane protein YckC